MKHTALVLLLGSSCAFAQSDPEPLYTPTGITNYHSATGKDRVDWYFANTVGFPSLAGGVVSAGWDTIFNNPKEYGPHWEGFGKRYGIRMSTVAVSNGMEAALSSLWGEDPRYIRAAGQPFKTRAMHVIKMSFLAQNRDGKTMPAYARYLAYGGSNFLSNTWRADSEATVSDASVRTGLGFLGRLASNSFGEFWPDVKQRVFHGKP